MAARARIGRTTFKRTAPMPCRPGVRPGLLEEADSLTSLNRRRRLQLPHAGTPGAASNSIGNPPNIRRLERS